jgi:predicted DNA-binding transcriptional regulator AlpA
MASPEQRKSPPAIPVDWDKRPQLLRKPVVVAITGRSYSSIRRDIARGSFPSPVPNGVRSIAWRSEEIAAWMKNLPDLRRLLESTARGSA